MASNLIIRQERTYTLPHHGFFLLLSIMHVFLVFFSLQRLFLRITVFDPSLSLSPPICASTFLLHFFFRPFNSHLFKIVNPPFYDVSTNLLIPLQNMVRIFMIVRIRDVIDRNRCTEANSTLNSLKFEDSVVTTLSYG